MKCKIEIDGVQKEVIISGVTKTERKQFVEKVKEMGKFEKDDSVDDGDKADKALEVLDWLESVGLEHSNLSDEEKGKLDLEASDIIAETTKEILQPMSDKKKS